MLGGAANDRHVMQEKTDPNGVERDEYPKDGAREAGPPAESLARPDLGENHP